MEERKHVWLRRERCFAQYGNLKHHYSYYYYICEDCGIIISEEEYNKLEEE